MTYTELAIQKAIEGGWEGLEFRDFIEMDKKGDIHARLWGESKLGEMHGMVLAQALLDPNFWQALTKSIGQGKAIKHTYRREIKRGCGKFITMKRKWRGGQRSWKFNWHSLIDHLAEGKSGEDYFESILK